jgi:hypothetical protein
MHPLQPKLDTQHRTAKHKPTNIFVGRGGEKIEIARRSLDGTPPSKRPEWTSSIAIIP